MGKGQSEGREAGKWQALQGRERGGTQQRSEEGHGGAEGQGGGKNPEQTRDKAVKMTGPPTSPIASKKVETRSAMQESWERDNRVRG